MADLRRIEKWNDWLEHGISNDVFSMHHNRAIWRRVHELIQANDRIKDSVSSYWGFQFETYAKAQAVAVRRQADTDEQSGSLGRMMWEMTKTPEALTRDWWLSLWRQDDDDPYWQRVAAQQWDDNFGGNVGRHLDPAVPTADLEELRRGSKRVKRFVDMHVAHRDARTIPRGTKPARRNENVKLEEIHDGIDLVGRMFNKYGGFLTASEWHTLTPIPQEDWEAIFEVAWKPPRPEAGFERWRRHQQAVEAAEEEAD